MKNKFITFLFKLINKKILNEKAWNGKPYYTIVEVKNIRTALVDDYCGGRKLISPQYRIDALFNKTVRNYYKYKEGSLYNKYQDIRYYFKKKLNL